MLQESKQLRKQLVKGKKQGTEVANLEITQEINSRVRKKNDVF